MILYIKQANYQLLQRSVFIGVLLSGMVGANLLAGTDTDRSSEAKLKPLIQKADPNPLSFDDGRVVFDLDERLRGEYKNNFYDWNSAVKSPTDGAWLLNRTRIGLKIQPEKWIRFYAQAQNAMQVGAGIPPIPGQSGAEGNDPVDLRQAYVEISDTTRCPFGLKLGRQELKYGDNRLIGPSDWNNLSRSFDALKLTYRGGGYSLDAFASSPVVVRTNGFNQTDIWNHYNGRPDRELFFSGLYFSSTPSRSGTFDAYALLLDQANGNVGTVEGNVSTAPLKGNMAARSDFITLGSRYRVDPVKLDGWEFGYEAAYQHGKVRGLDLNALAATAGAGYNWLDQPLKPRLYAEYNYASGDDSRYDSNGIPTGNKVGTFQNLFPSNHPFYGNMDLFSWQNLQNILVSTRITPLKSVTLQLDYNAFWLASNHDAWYRSNGISIVRPVRAAARSASPYVGSEIDLVATWNVNQHLQFQAGVSNFIAGEYLHDTGSASNAQFAYVLTRITY